MQLARTHSFYDTLYVVDPQGMGVVGVEYVKGSAYLIPPQQVQEFDVSFRAWFNLAKEGQNIFSQPLLSRATDNQVITIATPIYNDTGQLAGVLRGAVKLDMIENQVKSLVFGGYSKAYLIVQQQMLITSSNGIAVQPLETYAAKAIAKKESGAGKYVNIDNENVLGAYHYIPSLRWGLILEVEQKIVLHDAAELHNQLNVTLVIVVVGSIVVIVLLSIRVRLADQKKLADDQVTFYSNYDRLTGLPNQRVFQEFLEGELSGRAELEKNCALFLIDLDRFKVINDTFNHTTGDLLLKAFCRSSEASSSICSDAVPLRRR